MVGKLYTSSTGSSVNENIASIDARTISAQTALSTAKSPLAAARSMLFIHTLASHTQTFVADATCVTRVCEKGPAMQKVLRDMLEKCDDYFLMLVTAFASASVLLLAYCAIVLMTVSFVVTI